MGRETLTHVKFRSIMSYQILIALAATLTSSSVWASNLTYTCSAAKQNPAQFTLVKMPGNLFTVQYAASKSGTDDFDFRGTLILDKTYSSNTSSQYTGGVGAHALKEGVMLPQMLIQFSAIIPTNMINGTPAADDRMGGTVLVRNFSGNPLKYAKYACSMVPATQPARR